MNATQLKNSILQEAIEGRLVPQDPNDEPASVLLDKIRKEKAKLVKEKKLKKKDLEEISVTEEEKPFQIPESWEWCRVSDISESFIGLTYKPSDVSNKGWIVLRSSNIQDGNLDFCDIVRVNVDVPEKLHVRQNDIIICARNGSKKLVGKSALVKEVTEPMTFGAFMAICRTPFYRYMSMYLLSPLFFGQLRKESDTTTINQLTQKNFNKYLVPLPPLAEQKRIVAKIEELLPKVDEYGKAQESLDKLNEGLPERLKKSILQEAIEGRLVPQDPNDEPASVLLDKIRKEKARLVKEGKLKKKDIESIIIEEKNYPYTLPETWEWVRLQDVTTYISRGKSPIYSEIKKYPVVAQKCNQWSGFSLEKAKFVDPKTVDKFAEERLLRDCDLLWNSTGLGTLGRMAVYDSSVNKYGWAVADSHVTVIRTRPDFAYYKYLYYYFASPEVQSVIEDKSDGSTKQKELAQDTVKMYEVPLPPLAEQHRIVEKVEQLLHEIDKLKV